MALVDLESITVLRLEAGDALAACLPPGATAHDQRAVWLALRRTLDGAGHPEVPVVLLPAGFFLVAVRATEGAHAG